MNSSGKVLTIFLVIIAILLITLTAISLFFFQRETERRKTVEVSLEEYRLENTKLETEIKDVKKQNFLLEEKNKEADERVNDLSDELELEKGLREEMKIEAAKLEEEMQAALASREGLNKEAKAQKEMQERSAANLLASENKVKELETQLEVEIERIQKLEELYEQQLKGEAARLEEIQVLEGDSVQGAADLGVELEEIVVVPGEVVREDEVAIGITGLSLKEMASVFDRGLEGRVLSVDTETKFVIVNLGEKDGIVVGNVLSVYHNADYLGDIRITRLQPEMAAADLIPPFSIKNIHKNDQVKAK